MNNVPFLDLAAMHAELMPELNQAWTRAVSTSGFIGGEPVDRFEAEWANYCDTRHCVGLSNGTAAVQLALAALGIRVGDEVIVPTNTFVATVEAIEAVGATPVYIDVNPNTLLMTAGAVEAAITPRTAAVIAVHLYGQPVDMDAIARLAAKAGIAVIEDAAQAHGATWNGRRAGGLSAVGCFSFYPGKNLGAFGDAGAIVTNDGALAEKIRSIANHGRARHNPHQHDLIGNNYRLDALQAAVLSVKLQRLDEWNALRRRAAVAYDAALAPLPVEPVRIAAGAVSSYHLYVIKSAHRDDIRRALAADNIATGIHYPTPCHLQPAFATKRHVHLPVAEAAASQIMSLPMYPHLCDAGVAQVAGSLKQALRRFGSLQALAS
ncbi:MAG TPA: DegT/DnrJ/EryC1/StrS family aminotransferase [Dongiaceae bacterium]